MWYEQVIKCLLIVPFPESALNEEAGKLFMEDYKEYFKQARMLTQLYANPKELKSLENSMSNKKKDNEKDKKEIRKENTESMKKKWMKRI